MQMGIDMFMNRNTDLRWFISRSNRLDLLVSDNPEGEFIVPVTPKLCFILGFNVPMLSTDQVIRLNLASIARSKHYYFARSLSKCVCA